MYEEIEAQRGAGIHLMSHSSEVELYGVLSEAHVQVWPAVLGSDGGQRQLQFWNDLGYWRLLNFFFCQALLWSKEAVGKSLQAGVRLSFPPRFTNLALSSELSLSLNARNLGVSSLSAQTSRVWHFGRL